MSTFIVDNSFWEIFPEASVGVLVLDNLDNTKESSENVIKLLENANEEAKKHLTEAQLSQNPAISIWREAYQKFKTKKVVSLKYGMPCGAEDIDTFEGNLILGETEGGDEFYALGDEENSPTLAGEVCYRDGKGAVCRCFNWRDGKRTMITENTKKAFVVIEAVNSDRDEDITKALEEIAVYAGEELGAKKVRLELLKKDNNTLEL